MYLVGARDIVTPNAVVGMTIGVGGLAQFVAGMWLFPTGNTYAATGEQITSTFSSVQLTGSYF